ncbi:hypothetical protein Dsin_013840 [Dipteronia sinensis]|uniref:BHLH domain-containing protein n=1 Tax=Dipteronia sinensis TaxID=43782 RepID=A0AAE0ALQ7_9ROSI|nr:hypothetical protein Dsin_013840 [Dipteronia sinensis]
MMAGNPSWWSSMHIPPSQQPSPSLLSSQYHHLLGGSSSPSQLPMNSLADHHHNQEVLLPHSWSQLLLGGLPICDEDRFFPSEYDINHQPKKLENWEDYQTLINQSSSSRIGYIVDHVKQEALPQNSCNLFGHHGNNIIIGGDQYQFYHHYTPNPAAWSQQIMAVSSPRSCVTSLSSNNILDFSYNAEAADHTNNNNIVTQHNPDHHSSSECNSTATTGGVCKKARVQPSTSQPPLKVRKEKLGDRITSLHQLVSPFGKTDTASVLLEAIGYIRFLQSQIEALSSPYLGISSPNIRNNNQQFLLNDNCLKRKGGPNQEIQEIAMNLRSRGLCLVPVSCTQQVGIDINGSDYWAPAAAAFGGGL